MKFLNPEIEVVKFNVIDVIAASGESEPAQEATTLGPNDTPIS